MRRVAGATRCDGSGVADAVGSAHSAGAMCSTASAVAVLSRRLVAGIRTLPLPASGDFPDARSLYCTATPVSEPCTDQPGAVSGGATFTVAMRAFGG